MGQNWRDRARGQLWVPTRAKDCTVTSQPFHPPRVHINFIPGHGHHLTHPLFHLDTLCWRVSLARHSGTRQVPSLLQDGGSSCAVSQDRPKRLASCETVEALLLAMATQPSHSSETINRFNCERLFVRLKACPIPRPDPLSCWFRVND